MPFLCWLMLTVTELNQSLTYIVIIYTNVPHRGVARGGGPRVPVTPPFVCFF